MRMILLNGPSGCGKGEAYKLIRAVFNAGDGRVKARLHELASAFFQVPESLWEERMGKEYAHPRLGVLGHEYWRLGAAIRVEGSERYFNDLKNWVFLSPRQALIYISEIITKPTFGKTYFNDCRMARLKPDELYVDDSAGFPEEVAAFVPEKTLIIQVAGRGEFSKEDSRGWVTLPGAYQVTIDNSGSIEDYLRDVTNTVAEWLRWVK